MRDLNRNTAWAAALVDELALGGVRHAIVSPGSRSAPIALALADDARIDDRSVLDERSAAYLALGLARAAREPVAILCTSGTAAANYLPAVVEAHYSRVPLVVLTADRPPELRERDAGQVIEQRGLFGRYVRSEGELPTPEPDAGLLRQLRSATARAVAATLDGAPGPAHLNVPLREPLDPSPDDADARRLRELDREALGGRDARPYTEVRRAEPPRLSADAVAQLADALRAASPGWLACGPLDVTPDTAAAIVALGRRLGWPILAEPLSQLRSGAFERDGCVESADALLRSTELVDAAAPRSVLRLGAMPTSKAFRLALERRSDVAQRVVDPWGWSDPSALAAEVLRVDPRVLVLDLIDRLADNAADRDFADAWTVAGQRAAAAIAARLDAETRLSEPAAVRAVAGATPSGATVYLASSLAVRDADLFWPTGPRSLRFVASRGTNGIDGTLSSALGTALGSPGPTVLLSGDLALLHDASGLLTAAQCAADLTVVALDNDGGGIFEMLPAARSAPRESFERHLATPHGVDLARVIAGFGLRCEVADSPKRLAELVDGACARPGVDFVVARTDRRASAELRRELIAAAQAAARG